MPRQIIRKNMDINNNIKTDDELLMQFFSAAKQEIPDNGFSEKVMQRLPQRARRMNRIWSTICFAAGMAIFLLFDGIADLRMLAGQVMGDVCGYLSSIDLTGFSPLLLLASTAILGTVALYNILSTQR